MITYNKNTKEHLTEIINKIFKAKKSPKYILYGDIEYGKDYPAGYEDYDIYQVLNYLNNKLNLDEIYSTIEFESSFTPHQIRDKLIKENLMKPIKSSDNINVKDELLKMNANELSELLKKYSITASGKPKKLIKLAIKNIPKEEFNSKEYKVTSEGKAFLKDNAWITLYNFALDKFEFNDFYKYINEHDGSPQELSLNFIDQHLKIAIMNEDFEYYDSCFEAKELLYIYDNYDLQKALNVSVERYIRRLNPEFLTYSEYYAKYLIFNPNNLYHIHGCNNNLNNNLKKLFDEIWDSIEFKKEYVTSETAFDYLETILKNENYDELSDEYYEKYFSTAEELFKIGQYYSYKQAYDIAIIYYDLSLEEKPNQSKILSEESMCYGELNEFNIAMEIIDEAISIDSKNAEFWAIKGVCASNLNQYDNAKKYFDYSIELNPNDVKNLYDYAVFLTKNEEYDEAIKLYDTALEIEPMNIESLLYKIELYTHLKDWENVEKCFKKAYEIDGESNKYIFSQIKYYIARENFEKALEFCDNELQKDLNNYNYWILKSNIYYELNNNYESEKCFKNALKINPYLTNQFN